MSSDQNIIDSGKAMLIEIITALCHRPDLLTVEFRDEDSTIRIRVCAHPTDARIIVGTGAAHLKAIVSLSRLLFWGSHKLVQIMPIESVEGESEKPYQKFKALEDWQEVKLINLISRLSSAVFRDSTIAVHSSDENDWSSTFEVSIKPVQNIAAVKKFGSAVSILFIPIGTNHGRMIYASVKRK